MEEPTNSASVEYSLGRKEIFKESEQGHKERQEVNVKLQIENSIDSERPEFSRCALCRSAATTMRSPR